LAEPETLPLTGAKKPRFFYGYLVVMASFLAILVMYGTFHTFGVFFKPVLTEFGWTRAATAGAFSLRSLVHGLLSVVSGRLNDKFGPRLLISSCGFLLGLGYILMSQIGAIWHIYLFYGVMVGAGMGSGFVPIYSTVARWFVRKRGLMTGVVAAASGVGAVIMPPLASRLIIAYDWRTAYIIVGLIALVFTILAAQFFKRDPSKIGLLPDGANGEKKENLATAGSSLREALHNKQLWQLCAIVACSFFGVGVVTVHIVAHATEVGMSATSAANVLAVVGGLSIAGRVIMGNATDRIGSRLALIINSVVMTVPLFSLIGAKEAWMLYLLGAVFGFAFGGSVSLQSTTVAELFGLSSHGVILGVVTLSATIGLGIGPLVAGRIFDTTGSYSIAFLVSAIVSVIGIILASLLRPTGRQKEIDYLERSN
jgi:sugar phosphate permease